LIPIELIKNEVKQIKNNTFSYYSWVQAKVDTQTIKRELLNILYGICHKSMSSSSHRGKMKIVRRLNTHIWPWEDMKMIASNSKPIQMYEFSRMFEISSQNLFGWTKNALDHVTT
jgi:hypothetical protein